MKILKRLLIFSLLFLHVFVMPINANQNSLTIQYSHNQQNIQGINVETYYIADYVNNTYKLTETFKDYSIDLSNISSQSEYREIATTFASYIIADGLVADYMGVTNELGQVTYYNLNPGLYLTLSNEVQNGNQVIQFETFLTVVPNITDSFTVKPKYTSYEIEDIEKEYKVIKQWKDKNHISERVENVDVDIYKNKELYQSIQLNADNNWTYTWKYQDDGSEWNIVERSIDKNYDVSIYKDKQVFILTNTYPDDGDNTPSTGDTSNIVFYMVAMSICGLLLILLALLLRKKDHD